MRTEQTMISGLPYLAIKLEPITQKDKTFFIAKMLAKDLLEIYTVRPAEYDAAKQSSIASAFEGIDDYYSHLLSAVDTPQKEKDFQRNYDSRRVNAVTQFIETQETPFFPNTIIANCDLINDQAEFFLDENSSLEDFENTTGKPDHLSFLYSDAGGYKLLIPQRMNSVLVIDGQHRLRGLAGCNEDIKASYELIVAFIIGFDRSVVAQQFYTINYEQKPVNKSLLYHLTAEFSNELDSLTFMHQVVKLLNEVKGSPFYHKIKMLGATPRHASNEEKSRLSISQAFLIDHLLRLIDPRGLQRKEPPVFLYYYNHKSYHSDLIRFIMNYFSAIKEINEGWDTPDESLLSKGMGVGAYIRALHMIFPYIFVYLWKEDIDQIKSFNKDDFIEMLDGVKNIDFTRNGEYGGVGSAGSIGKIKQRILSELNLPKGDEVERFQLWLRSKYGVNNL